MIRMSRAGRVKQVCRIMALYDKKNKGGCLSTGDIAKKCGIKSNSKFKNLLRDMERDGIIKMVQFQPRYECGYCIDGWRFNSWEQMTLPSHEIVINGISMRSL